MNKEVNMTFRVESDLKDGFNAAAERNHQPAEQVLRDFMKDYVRRQQADADAAMQAIIEARLEAIEEAHANNLIEGLDMGAETLAAMLERAREPISDEEFTRREKALWLERHRVVEVAVA